MEFKALKITKEEFIKICNESLSMSEAMRKTNLHRVTFTKYAKLLNCFKPNQGLKGETKITNNNKFKQEYWNKDLLIEVSRACLKKNIFKLKLIPIECNKCHLKEWNNLTIPLELNHINGNGHENKKSNIELLCPNCHAQTETYRGKNLVLKYGKQEPQKYNKEKAKAYKEKIKNRKPNKWHSFSKTREQFKKEIEDKKLEKIKLIKESNIDFSKHWRSEVSKLTKMTSQYSGIFVKKYIPEIWDKCFKHKC